MPTTKTTKKTSRPSRSSATKRTVAKTKPAAKAKKSRRPLLHPIHISVGALLLLVIGGAFLFAGIGKPQKSDAAGCTVSSNLVNSCRPWLGAAVNNYPQAADNTKAQILYHEQRIGRQLDLVHTYHPIGDNKLDDTDKFFATRKDTYLFANWKPAEKWKEANGSNGNITAGIDQMAASIKSVAPNKIFLTLNHEPENDVSGGASGCSVYRGSAGTPADYRAMWKHVRDRFDAKGVNNVVWVMDYMNYSRWDCMIDDLYPGNHLVDWVMYNGYSTTMNYVNNVKRFQDVLASHQDAAHDFASKPQGIVEWGVSSELYSTAQQMDYFDQVNTAIKNNTFPSLKAYMIFDSKHKGDANGASFRVGYGSDGKYSSASQERYNKIVNTIFSMSSSTPTPAPPTSTKDIAPPTVNLATPADGATVSGKVKVTGTASDNKKVKAVTLRVNDKWVASDESAPYEFQIDTTKYPDGKNSIVLRAWDPTDNMAQSKTIVVTVNNRKSGGSTQSKPPASSTTVIDNKPDQSSNKPISSSGTLIVSPSIPGNSIQVWINGKLQPTNTIDTLTLTNGIHTLRIVENGLISTRLVSVNNPPLLAALNEARANALLYTTLFVAAVVTAVVWLGRSYVLGFTSRRERAITKAQRKIK